MNNNSVRDTLYAAAAWFDWGRGLSDINAWRRLMQLLGRKGAHICGPAGTCFGDPWHVTCYSARREGLSYERINIRLMLCIVDN